MTSKCKCLLILPCIVIAILILTYCSYVIGLCVLIVPNIVQSCLYIVFFNIIFVMLLWSFLTTVFTPVATVPLEYKLTDEENDLLKAGNETSMQSVLETICNKKNLVIKTRYPADRIRYCFKCKQIKPDRAHHCSVCGVCVLKMDHHCPWVNNCIGFSNYKSFVLLQLYTTLLCLYIACTSLFYVKEITTDSVGRYTVVGFFVVALFGLLGATFLIFHCFLLAKNETGIDKLQKPFIIVENGTFNLGYRENFKEVFGTKWYTWVLPIQTSLGTGYTFTIRVKQINHSPA